LEFHKNLYKIPLGLLHNEKFQLFPPRKGPFNWIWAYNYAMNSTDGQLRPKMINIVFILIKSKLNENLYKSGVFSGFHLWNCLVKVSQPVLLFIDISTKKEAWSAIGIINWWKAAIWVSKFCWIFLYY
jgi:hypothetical protein